MNKNKNRQFKPSLLSKQSGFAMFEGLLVVVAICIAALLAIRVVGSDSDSPSADIQPRNTSKTDNPLNTGSTPIAQQQAVEQTVKGLNLNQDTLYSVELNDATVLYGRIQRINQDYVGVADSYETGESAYIASRTSLFHAPEGVALVRISSIAKLLELKSGEVYDAIKTQPQATANSSAPGDINDYLQSHSYQAIHLANGQLYFGSFKDVDTLVATSDIFKLHEYKGGSSTQVQLSLALVDSAELSDYTAADVIIWENMSPAGNVGEAISRYYSAN